MIGRRWALVAGLATLLLDSGCVSCGHQVCKPALDAGPYSEAPLCDRRHVYAFLINGLTPAGSSGLDGLRVQLAERGYEKTYRGELCHAGWMEREMKRVRACDPSARFVVIGYDFGCSAASALARNATRQGLPVDAAILLDPVVLGEVGSRSPRTVVIRSGIAVGDEGAECVCVPTGSHWTLPTNARTVDAIGEVLKGVAANVVHPPVVQEAEFEYEDAPPRVSSNPAPGTSEDWLFLHDQFGTHTRALAPMPKWTSTAPVP